MLNSEFVHFMRTAFNPFMPNGISRRDQVEQSISNLRDVRWHFSFLGQVWYLIVSIPDLCNLTYFNRKLCKQTVETLIRRRILWHLIWVCTICLIPQKDASHIWVKKQLFCLSHKSCRNLGGILLK